MLRSTLKIPEIDREGLPHELANLIRRVSDLPQEDGEDEGPTEYSVHNTVSLLLDAGDALQGRFPHGSAATTPQSGVQVYWRGERRFLQLSIPAHEGGNGFIYHEDDAAAGTTGNVSATVLAEWIRWFLDA